MRWYLNPKTIVNAVRDGKSVVSGGGPKSVRLIGVGNPRGIVFPRIPLLLEVVGRDGSTTKFTPEVPIGVFAGYGYRIARLLHVPIIRDLDPGSLRAEVRVPGR